MSAKALSALVLILGGALLNACVSVPRTRAEYIRGSSQCSTVPEHTVCECAGMLEPATPEDNKLMICAVFISLCRGQVHDCVVVK